MANKIIRARMTSQDSIKPKLRGLRCLGGAVLRGSRPGHPDRDRIGKRPAGSLLRPAQLRGLPRRQPQEGAYPMSDTFKELRAEGKPQEVFCAQKAYRASY
jgi:hypothetical protein